MRVLLVTEAVEFAERFKKMCGEEHYLGTFLTPELAFKETANQEYEFAICDEDFLVRIKSQFQGPVFALSSTSSSKTWVASLQHGADGIFFNDQSVEGILLQLLAYQRRWSQKSATRRFLPRYGMLIDLDKYRVELNGKVLNLTLTELKVLKELANEDNRVVSRSVIQQEVFGQLSPGNRSLDVHVCSLRKKLRPYGLDVESVRGVGYRLLQQDSPRLRSVASDGH